MSPTPPARPYPPRSSAAWPPAAGEYFVLPENRSCHVAVSTLASIPLAEELARLAPKGLCIVGKTETENIGIDKVIKNTITNPSIHCLIVAGRDSEGHRSGATLLSLCERGVDERMRVIGSPGRKPVLKNVTRKEVEENFPVRAALEGLASKLALANMTDDALKRMGRALEKMPWRR